MEYRDPIYGFVAVSDLEQSLVDLPEFQRLRRIAQLGPTNLVYPSANHTRFEHSLGTLHVSKELLAHLLSDRDSSEAFGWDNDQKADAQTLLRLAALLHDTGHPPFSHATEDLFPEAQSHEHYTYRMIAETEIGERIDRQLGDGVRIRVAEIAVGRPKTAMDSFLSELLAGDIGTDRTDYLIRDSHHLGVAYGRFDRHRLFNTLFVRDNPDKGGPELALEDDGIHTVEGFLLARYFMFLEVYFHKTRRILDTHLTEFLKSWLPDGLFPEDLDRFTQMDDIQVTHAMLGCAEHSARRIPSRGFMRTTFETVDHPPPEELVAFKWLVSEVYERFGKDNIRIDEAEKAPYSYAEPPMFVRTTQGYKPLDRQSSLVRSLSPNPPKDTDGRREESGRGVRELQGK